MPRGGARRTLIVVTYTERIVNAMVRGALRLLCRMNVDEFRKLPRRGPAILMSNHTTNLEGPAYYVFIQPRPATALGKRELWRHWYTRFFMELWQIVPVRRGQVDRSALRSAVRALDEGQFLGIAPEGTRSTSGALQHAQPGIALLATWRSVPVYPVVHWGLNDLGRNMRRLRRTRVTFRIGRPFRVRVPEGARLGAKELREITDEMMYQAALLMPPRLRGAYADVDSVTTRYLEFLDA